MCANDLGGYCACILGSLLVSSSFEYEWKKELRERGLKITCSYVFIYLYLATLRMN